MTTDMNLGPWDASDLQCGLLLPIAKNEEKQKVRLAKFGALGLVLVGLGLTSLAVLSPPSQWTTVATSVRTNGGRKSAPPPTVEAKRSVLEYSELDFLDEFDSFMVEYGKSYEGDEYKSRYQNFKRNMLAIHLHDKADAPYRLGVNQFADLSYEEYKSNMLNYKSSKTARPVNWLLGEALVGELPSTVDWRQGGCVTEVKNQGQCGSCWSFAATGAMEGNICVQTGQLHDLSEQELVDCARPEGNHGCHGGEVDWAFQYVMDRGGLCSEKDYPYEAKEGTCRADTCTPDVMIEGFVDVPPHNPAALMSGLMSYGPVAVAIEADQVAFQFYRSGVLNATCGEALDHAVLVVGYGYDEDSGLDYWVVKNSWGSSWGEGGFVRMVRDPEESGDGECGILMEPSYADITTEFQQFY